MFLAVSITDIYRRSDDNHASSSSIYDLYDYYDYDYDYDYYYDY